MKAFAGQVLIFKRPPVYSFFSFFLVVVFFSSSAYIHAAAVQADWRFIRFGACLVACVADHVLLASCLALLRRYSLLADQPLAPVPQLIRVWLVATFAPSKLSSFFLLLRHSTRLFLSYQALSLLDWIPVQSSYFIVDLIICLSTKQRATRVKGVPDERKYAVEGMRWKISKW